MYESVTSQPSMFISDLSGPVSYRAAALGCLTTWWTVLSLLEMLILPNSELQLVGGIDDNKTFAFNMGSE